MRKLVSIVEAARQLGVSRRTIERALASGRLEWCGQTGRGRYARGIDLGAARKLFAEDGQDGVARQRKKPVIERVRGFLKCLEDGQGNKLADPKQVMGVYMQAAANGGDVDFLAFCIDRLVSHDGLFVLRAMGCPVRQSLSEPLVNYTADRLRSLAGPAVSPQLLTLNFAALWRFMAWWWARCEVEAEPLIVYDTQTRLAEVRMRPKWPDAAPPGSGPELGFRVSVAEPRRSQIRMQAHKVATKLMRKVEEQGGLADSDSELTKLYDAFRRSVCDNRAYLRTAEYEVQRAFAENQKWVAESLGIEANEIRVLEQFIRFLSGEALTRSTRQVGENDAVANDPAKHDDEAGSSEGVERGLGPGCGAACGLSIPYRTMGQVFGASRQTISKWVRQAAREAQGRVWT
jgi:excisionase family DNA binding protein